MAPVEPSALRLQNLLDNYIKTNVVMIFSKSTCGYCKKVKDLFKSSDVAHNSVDLDTLDNGSELHKVLVDKYKQQTVPCVFIHAKLIGGYTEVAALHSESKLLPLVLNKPTADIIPQTPLDTGRWSPTPGRKSPAGMNSPAGMMSPRQKSPVGGQKSPSTGKRSPSPARALTPEPLSYDYDLIVIGGGSGGLAAAKEAADLKMKVACLDFVKPSEQGTTWGLGGTCVNVGCIPKKLMHQAAILGHCLEDAREFGWEFSEKVKHNWETLTSAVQDHIGGLNWNYRVQLRSKSVNYVNAYAQFIGPHRIKCTKKNGNVEEMTAKYFIIATGGRPRYPDIPGAKEHCISSDDLFSLATPPGKTLLVGASYVSLECAGFLAALGYDVTVMVRSILLRGFDQQMADSIGKYMETECKVKFIRKCVPTKVEKFEKATHKLHVSAVQDGKPVVGDYDTVMMAVGRDPCTKNIGLETIDVKTDKSGYIVAKDDEQTSCPYVYAVGDVLAGKPELTPVAIHAGKLLARRLFTTAKLRCDYTNVATTVFTPIEYGAIGLSEEDSIAKYGKDNIDVYHANYFPLEWTIPHKTENVCYAKLICIKSQKNRVVGFHVLGPNAGEMTQGFAIGMKMGATKDQFDNCIGIHPTCAEVFTKLSITKASGADVSATGC